MDQHETSIYNQAITLAKMGHREQAYSFFKSIAKQNPQDQDVNFWLVYTASSLELAQALLDHAYTINPDSPALRQADQWLTNEKLNLPQPAEGYSLFPPVTSQTQVVPYYTTRPGDPYSYFPSQPVAPYYPTPPTMPYYQTPPTRSYYPAMPVQAAPYYPTQQLAPYRPYPPASAYQPYPTQHYPQLYYQGPQSYVQPYYHQSYPQPGYYPPVRWGNAPANAYAYYMAMGSNYRCPFCNTPYPPISNRRISTSGWVTFAVMAALFFPLAWVGLLMQENYLRCSHCRLNLT